VGSDHPRRENMLLDIIRHLTGAPTLVPTAPAASDDAVTPSHDLDSVYAYLMQNGASGMSDIARGCEMPVRLAQKAVHALEDAGRVKGTGNRRGRRYAALPRR
jgi:hypothetical protein